MHSHLLEHGLDLVLCDAALHDLGVGEDVLDAREVGQLALDVRLHEHRAHLVDGREAVHLAVRDGAHQRRLARVVATQQSVPLPAQQLQVGVVQQNLSIVVAPSPSAPPSSVASVSDAPLDTVFRRKAF